MQLDAINVRLFQLSGQHYHKQITEAVYRAQRHELLKCALMESEGSELELLVPIESEPEVAPPAVIDDRQPRTAPSWFMVVGVILLVLTGVAVVVLAAL